jgi:hypothetical protein
MQTREQLRRTWPVSWFWQQQLQELLQAQQRVQAAQNPGSQVLRSQQHLHLQQLLHVVVRCRLLLLQQQCGWECSSRSLAQ